MAAVKYLYNTNLAKGTGFINESLMLIEFYEEGEECRLSLNILVPISYI